MQVLDDPGGNPTDCSVDPTTGNLAVVNISSSSGSGNVAIYTGATETPSRTPIRAFCILSLPGYDNKGDLFVSGLSSSFAYQLAELPSGSSSYTNLTVSGATVFFAGQVQWAGTYLLVGDQTYLGEETSAVYQMTVDGITATVHGVTPFTGSIDVIGFYKRGSGKGGKIIAPDFVQSQAYIYTFPSGSPGATITDLTNPYGVAISQRGN